MRKITLNQDVVSAIEKTLLTSPASYPYLETLSKTFLASTGLHSWKQEDIFARAPIRRLVLCLNNRIFCQSQIVQYQQMMISVFISLRYQTAYIDNGHGISLTDYPNHFIMVFDLTSTQQASHDFIHPELTNCKLFNFNRAEIFGCIAQQY